MRNYGTAYVSRRVRSDDLVPRRRRALSRAHARGRGLPPGGVSFCCWNGGGAAAVDVHLPGILSAVLDGGSGGAVGRRTVVGDGLADVRPGGACLLAAAAHSSWMRQTASRLFTPRRCGGCSCVVSPAVSLLLAYWRRGSRHELGLAGDASTEHQTIDVLHAITDAGRRIELFKFSEIKSVTELERLILAEETLEHQVIRIAKPDGDFNCHGWTFTGGKYGVPSDCVDMILADNGYVNILHPQAGDLVVYRDEVRQVTHSGVVRVATPEDLVLIESKWGPLGIYLHMPESSPYGHYVRYYRSAARGGHLLRLSEAAGRARRRSPRANSQGKRIAGGSGDQYSAFGTQRLARCGTAIIAVAGAIRRGPSNWPAKPATDPLAQLAVPQNVATRAEITSSTVPSPSGRG